MFAFVGLTQNHLLVKNRIYELAILLCAAMVLLRPYLLKNLTGQPLFIWYIAGTVFFAIAHLTQWPRRKKAQSPIERSLFEYLSSNAANCLEYSLEAESPKRNIESDALN